MLKTCSHIHQFPSYLATNASTLSPSDKERYEQQHIRVQQIVTIFEREDYKDGDEVTGEGGMGAEVVRLMNEVCFLQISLLS